MGWGGRLGGCSAVGFIWPLPEFEASQRVRVPDKQTGGVAKRPPSPRSGAHGARGGPDPESWAKVSSHVWEPPALFSSQLNSTSPPTSSTMGQAALTETWLCSASRKTPLSVRNPQGPQLLRRGDPHSPDMAPAGACGDRCQLPGPSARLCPEFPGFWRSSRLPWRPELVDAERTGSDRQAPEVRAGT